MTKTLSFFNRLAVFLLGLLLILAGLFPIAEYWQIPYLVDAADFLDRTRLIDLAYQDYYITALIIGAIVAAILGLWILLANIRSRAFSNRGILPADPEHGETVINVQRVSEAACSSLEHANEIRRASSKVAMVGQRPTATFTVFANPEYPLEDAIRVIEAADQDFRMANHTMEIDTVWKLHLDRITA
ncbi:hypothetical protein [Corynebacterium sp. MSK008]|uniref:hypothetical protein n=1 Tax=Corynebacterium sp. MSK008 TaxID=3050188 RepID=UPI00254B60EE|nr:hypothetical protein [Corynebacterium sp. MSK008]MDK8879404.1 hypothetical protein [Corynebacterium sp. MSK008]